MTESQIIIKYGAPANVRLPVPWPIAVNRETWRVTSGLGPDDGAVLIGFGPVGQTRITVLREAAVSDPSSVTGLAATFSKDGGFFEWEIPIKELTLWGRAL